MSERKITIAIDGYSSCGKSTIAKGLSKRLGYVFIDSGAMYRAVTLFCIQNHIIKDGKFNEQDVVKALDAIHIEFKFNPETQSSDMYLNDVNVANEIREMGVSNFVSPISALKEVRTKVIEQQRKLGKGKRIVMDGRDIGTNVFPDAELKIFMIANQDVRVQRRWKELEAKGVKVSQEEVRKNIDQRDHDDTHREHNPLRKADDAVVLDNTYMTPEEQLNFAIRLAKEKIEG